MNDPLVDFEAEQSVIGAILSRPDAMADVVDWLLPEWFSDARTRSVYAAMVRLWYERTPADVITVPAELVRMGAKSEIAAMDFLNECEAVSPIGAYAEHYGEIVRRMAWRREIEQVGAELVRVAHAGGDVDTDDLIVSARRRIESFERTRATPATMREQIESLRDLSLRIWSGDYVDRVVSSGIRDLDRMLSGGFRGGEMIVLGAKQSMGKTATMLHIATAEQPYDRNDPTKPRTRSPWLVFSLEMSETAINRRIIATEAGVPFETAMSPVGDVMTRDRWLEATERVETWPLKVIAQPRMTTGRIEAIAERELAEREVAGIMIDHLGLLNDSTTGRSDYEKVSEISKRLKGMAMKLDLPVLVLHQLNREVERRSSCMPQMSDLRDSGKVAEDADVVALLFNRMYYVKREILEPNDDLDWIQIGDVRNYHRIQLSVHKNRNGDTGTVNMGWEPKAMRLVEAA